MSSYELTLSSALLLLLLLRLMHCFSLGLVPYPGFRNYLRFKKLLLSHGLLPLPWDLIRSANNMIIFSCSTHSHWLPLPIGMEAWCLPPVCWVGTA